MFKPLFAKAHVWCEAFENLKQMNRNRQTENLQKENVKDIEGFTSFP